MNSHRLSRLNLCLFRPCNLWKCYVVMELFIFAFAWTIVPGAFLWFSWCISFSVFRSKPRLNKTWLLISETGVSFSAIGAGKASLIILNLNFCKLSIQRTNSGAKRSIAAVIIETKAWWSLKTKNFLSRNR